MKALHALMISIAILAGAALAALLVLRVTGLDPANVPPSTVIASDMRYFVRPGLWLRGTVVSTPVTDWSFINKVPSAALETHTRYLIPLSVRVSPFSRSGLLYIGSGQVKLDKMFPADKAWTSNVARDPRVRLKVNDKIYELVLVLVTDSAEFQSVLHHGREYFTKGPDGQPKLDRIQHLFRAYQRNVAEYDAVPASAQLPQP
jgi:hypothetical protein